MKFTLFQYSPAWYKITIALFVVLACLILASLISIVIAAPIFNLGLDDIRAYLTGSMDSQNIPLLKFIQIITSAGTFVLPSIILAYLFSGQAGEYLKTNKKPIGVNVIIIVFSIFIAIPLINYIAWLNSMLILPDSMSGLENKIRELENQAGDMMESFMNTTTIGGYLVNLLMIAILPAIGEEFLFRGIFQRLFSEWTKNIHLGIFLAAILFSFTHLQFYGFVPRLLLGIYFGYLLIWSRTIWIPVIAHFVNNAAAITFYQFERGGTNSNSVDRFGTSPDDLFYLLLSLFLFIVLTVTFYYLERNTRSIQSGG